MNMLHLSFHISWTSSKANSVLLSQLDNTRVKTRDDETLTMVWAVAWHRLLQILSTNTFRAIQKQITHTSATEAINTTRFSQIHTILLYSGPILIFNLHSRLGLPRRLLISGFPTKILYVLLISTMRATWWFSMTSQLSKLVHRYTGQSQQGYQLSASPVGLPTVSISSRVINC